MDDVLIVGAGPTGLMLACWLAANGVRARVVDPKSGPTVETRAVAVQARTLEIWEILGVADRALERGHKVQAGYFWADGRQVGKLPLAEMGKGISPYSFVFMLGQDQTERLFYERLQELGGDVEWGVAATAIEGNRVTLEPLSPPGERGRGEGSVPISAQATPESPPPAEQAEFRFILGCDGARSVVRKAAGLEFEGGTYDARFFVADLDATGGVIAGELNISLFGDRFYAFFPLKDLDRYRLVGLLDPSINPETATVEDVRPDIERLMRTQIGDVRWFSPYRVHHRVVRRFRAGPLFLCGDAAHVHSPVGGQGMNTGLGDAVNLAWKLVEVLKHDADERLLDTYDAERRPFAEWLVANTDRAFELIVRQTPLARFVRLRIVPVLMPLLFRLPFVRRFAFRTISQTRISYRNGPLAQGPGSGDRCLLLGAKPDRWTFVGTESAKDWCENRGIALVAGKEAKLVRPDGYTGMAAGQFDATTFDRYLREKVGRPA